MRTVESTPEVIRVQEFARRLQISVWTARQWAYRGKVASCKAGKHLLIPAGEVTRLIAENTRPRVVAQWDSKPTGGDQPAERQ